MNVLREIFDPAFLLRDALHTSILIGLACPVVGVFLVLRRMVFLGVALPQISSTGVALALSLHALGHLHVEHGAVDEHSLAFVGALTTPLHAEPPNGLDRLYVLDCGTARAADTSRWSPGVDVGKPLELSDNCYLLHHAQGWQIGRAHV